MSKARSVYCIFCGQTYVSTAAETCSLCGKSGGLADPDDPDALRDLKAKKQQEANGSPQQLAETLSRATEAAHQLRRIVLQGLGGPIILVVGFALLFVRDLRSDPNSLTMFEILLGVPLIIAGAFSFLLAGFNLWNFGRNSADTTHNST